jgi:thiamine biosynthesis lipoprotein ApbE
MTDGPKLDSHHRKTVEKLFAHPTSHNIQWHDVLSLLQAAGEAEEVHDGRFKVTLGAETQTFDAPKSNDLDTQQVVDLRRMLTNAGLAPA